MAKILLVTETLSPTVVKLATSLRHQQHQVTVLTSRDEDAKLPDGIDLLRPFKKWSTLEALRVAPVIYGLSPQIVHLVLSEDRLNMGQILLSLLAKTIPHTVLTTSLLHINYGLRRKNPVRYLIQESDVVTCPSVETLGALRGLNVKHVRQGRGLLPPVLDFDLEERLEERSQGMTDLLRRLSSTDFLVMPFTEASFDPHRPAFRRLTLLTSHRHIVLLGSFANWTLRERKKFQAWMERRGLGAQWTLTGELSRPDLRRLLAKSEALILAGQTLSPPETTEYFLHAIQAGTTLVLDDRQSTIHADLWRDGKNCWILPADGVLHRLQTLLAAHSLRRPQSLPEKMEFQRDLIDAPLNELNRLYNKALSLKHVL